MAFLGNFGEIPDLEGATAEDSLKKIRDYLFLLKEQLDFVFRNLDMGNLNENGVNELKNVITGELHARVDDGEQNIARLSLTAEALSTDIRQQDSRMTSLEQDAGGFALDVRDKDGNLSSVRLRDGVLDLRDLVFSVLGESGETVIDGGNIRTGRINGASFYTERRKPDDTIESALGISGGEMRFYSGGEDATYDSSVAVLDVMTGQLSLSSGETSAGCDIGFDGMVRVGSETNVKLDAPAYTVTNPAAFRSALGIGCGAAATVSTATAGLGNGADVNLYNIERYDPLNAFTNARYSASYGYGLRANLTGKYLITASGNVVSTAGQDSTLAIRKVSGGMSSYLMRSQVHHTNASNETVSIAPFVVSLAAGDCLSLYLSNAKTTVNGLKLTAVYLG